MTHHRESRPLLAHFGLRLALDSGFISSFFSKSFAAAVRSSRHCLWYNARFSWHFPLQDEDTILCTFTTP